MNLEDHAFNAAPPGQHERVSCVTLSMAEAAIKAAVSATARRCAEIVHSHSGALYDACHQAKHSIIAEFPEAFK